ncbi:MAG TPA: SDR family oxidoreductase [Candidatus Sulfotelmatobacter sp.]|nr:SDR family oxidoreductase [Candidatus Sulfotelmatobacter sp.]
MTAAAPVTLITGATRGIGRATADRLARAGHCVIGIARSADASFPGELHLADAGDEAGLRRTLAEITARQEVDNLINNAGLNRLQTLEEIRLDDFQRVSDVNLRAALLCVQACVPAMKRSGRGRIVNVGSRAQLGRVGASSYAAAKAGLVALSRCWALELAPSGITVNLVAPGPIDTEMFRRNNPPDRPQTQAILGSVPMRRMGRPEEVAAAIAYFLSDEAGFTTGQTLYVCGGLSVGAVAI